MSADHISQLKSLASTWQFSPSLNISEYNNLFIVLLPANAIINSLGFVLPFFFFFKCGFTSKWSHFGFIIQTTLKEPSLCFG